MNEKATQGIFITGFLGAGKTTLALCLIAHARQQGRRVACIVNDLGPINIDAARIAERFPDIHAEDLSNACIGCNGKEQFYPLVEAKHHDGVDLILVEPTGILLGEEIAQITQDCSRWCNFRVITLIRVPRFLKGGAVELSQEATASQLKLANVVGLTWCNYLPEFSGMVDQRLFPVHEFIGVYAPGTPTFIVPDEGESLDADFLTEVFSVDKGRNQLSALVHDAHHHARSSAFSITLRSGLTIQDILETLGSEIKKIMRMKGDAGMERFDWVEGSLRLFPLDHPGSQEMTIITSAGETIAAGSIAALSLGPGTPSTPTIQQTEAAIRELLLKTAPLRPSLTTILPLDGQTYLAYSLSRKEGVDPALRAIALRTVVERLVQACKIIHTLSDADASAKRSAGAFLSFFATTHQKEISVLSKELAAAAREARPAFLWAEGVMPLTTIGAGTGITGAAVRPAFVKHVIDFAREHSPEDLPRLAEAFRHAGLIAAKGDGPQWHALQESC